MNRLLIFLLISILFSQCKKDEDEEVPQVFFEYPTENQSYKVLDLISLKIRASDNQKLERLSVSLVKANGKQLVLSAKSIELNQASYVWETNYLLSDSLLESGNYFLKAEAFDGNNSFSAFRLIRVEALAKRRIGILAALNHSSSAEVYEFSNGQSKLLLHSISTLKEIACNSYDQALWLLPNKGNEINAYRLKSSEKVYQAEVMSSFSNPFEDLVVSNRQTFYSHSGGRVKGVSSVFGDNFLHQAESNLVCKKIAVNDQSVLVEECRPNGSNRRITYLYRVSGATYNSLSLQQAVVDFFLIDHEKAILLQNENGKILIHELSLSISGKRLMRTINGMEAKKLVALNNREILILTNQSVIRYNFTTNNFYTVVSTSNAVDIAYDVVQNSILLAKGNEVFEYDPINGNPIDVYTFPSIISCIAIRYNR